MNTDLTVLDACCGSRMFWFDRKDPRCLFMDKRFERHELVDSSSVGGKRNLIIEPDMVGDFRNLPFGNESFYLVVFDPPHLLRNGESGWQAKKYGKLKPEWAHDIATGFSECFRVLRPFGTLVFKWNETDIAVSRILELTPAKPLIGNRSGARSKSHWLVFQKEG